MKKVVDGKPAQEDSYAWLVFARNPELRNSVSRKDWIMLTIVELMVGEELLEQLVTTASYTKEGPSGAGHFLHFSDLAPAGLVTNALRAKIYQVLYYKYYRQYRFLTSESPLEERGDVVDLRRDRFAMVHDLLYQIIAFRRVYIIAWVVANLTIDAVVFTTMGFQAALVSALGVEGLRRLARL